MIRRSTRLGASAGAAALVIAGAGLTIGTVGASGEEGWAVDAESCPDPDAVNAPIEGEILIGSAMPLSGEAAAVFEPAARGFEAYINYANAKGLLPGMTISVDIKDDQYNPANTPGAVDELIDGGAHLIAGLIGTGGAEAVRDTLNEECIPMLNLLTGDPRWGLEMADYPWTTGLLISYGLESRGYAESIAQEFPDQSVGLYYVNNAFGNVYMDAFRVAADEQGLEIVTEQNIEQGVTDLPAAQVQALAESGAGVIMATPLGIQCITFLNALAEAKAANPDWAPTVYMTNTCASALILAAAGEAADGIYTSASMGLIDVNNPEVAATEPAAGYIAEMEAQGLGDIITTGSAGWNAAEVTVQVLIDAAASPDGLTRASIINAARNLNYHPSLVREGMNYVMNGEDDAFYAEDIQIVRYRAADAFFDEIGEPFVYESSPDAGDPVMAGPITPSGAEPVAPATTTG